MDNNQITFHIGNDASVGANAYMLIDGNNTKIFVYKAMECQSTFATNSIQTYSGSDININSHLNINTANTIKIGTGIISYYENVGVIKNLEITNTDKALGVISFDCGLEGTDTDINVATMSWDNLSVFKPSYFYDPIVINGGSLTTENIIIGASNKLSLDATEIYSETNDTILRNTNTANSIRFVIGLDTTYADNKVVLNNGSNSELRGDWTIDGDMTFGITKKINLRHLNSDAILKLEASTNIDSYINGTKYLQLDDTQFTSFNGFNLSSDRRLKDNIEDVDDDTIDMVKNIKVKTFIKNQKTRKTELGWIAQDVQQYTKSKYNIVNDTGEYLTMCYDRIALLLLLC